MHSFPTAGYDGPLPNANDPVVMTGLQIFMSRDLFSWPLYTIVIALGQVRTPET
jgi:alpha-1,3-glucan synthase